MLKLIHGADFHLDSPFSGLTPEQAALRREEQRELLADLARLAREKGADLVLLSGDLLDGRRVYRETAQALAAALAAIPCPVFIAPGNHDYCSPQSVYATLDWPDNVHIFRSPQVEGVSLPQLNCTVWGAAFCAPHREDSPLAGFRAEGAGLHLMCLHGDLSPQSSYGPIRREEAEASGLDYLALGHVHQSGFWRAGKTVLAYPGCPQGRGFDETGAKGVLYVEVEPGRVVPRFLPLARRRYEEVSVPLTNSANYLTTILAALPEHTAADIYRIRLTGEAPAPNLPALEQALAPRFFGLTLRDETRLPQDLWARREEDTLTGLFLQAMWERCQAAPDDQTCQLAARFGLAALENGEEAAL